MIVKSLFNTIRPAVGLVIVLAFCGMASARDDGRDDGGSIFRDDNPDQQCTCTLTPPVIPGVTAPSSPTPGINYCSYSAPFPNVSTQMLETYLPRRVANARIVYDPTTDTSFGELRLPPGNPPPGGWPVVVYIHLGAWSVDYTLDEPAPFLEKLTNVAGVATWSLEWRRIGSVHGGGSLAGDAPSGGWPNSFLDVGKGTDYVRTLAATYPLNLNRVIVMGHSSGGHLAAWVAGRHNLPTTADLYVANPLPLVGLVVQEGKVDLETSLLVSGRTDVYTLLGTVVYAPDGTLAYSGDSALLAQRLAEASPINLLPFGMPERLIVGALEPQPGLQDEQINFVQRARAGGDDAQVVLEMERVGASDDLVPDATGWPTEIGAVLSVLKPDTKLTGCAGASWPKHHHDDH